MDWADLYNSIPFADAVDNADVSRVVLYQENFVGKRNDIPALFKKKQHTYIIAGDGLEREFCKLD